MTPDAYRATVKSLGLTPYRPSHGGITIHQDRQGEFWGITDPEPYTPEERVGLIHLLKIRMGISTH